MKRILALLGACGVLISLGAGCDQRGVSRKPAPVKSLKAGERLQVITSFLPLYCFAANVAGDAADVVNLLPPGVGPHDYQFTPSDARKVGAAHVVVVNGLGLDDWLGRSIKNLGAAEQPRIVTATSGLGDALIEDGGHDHAGHDHGHHHHGHHNPHFWVDPALAERAVLKIAEVLQTADPDNADAYAQNAETYIKQLQALDKDLTEKLKSVKGKPFVTFHNAFPYFVRRYDLSLAAIVEEVPDVNPSAKQLTELYETVRITKAKALFTEPQFSAKLAQRISEDLGVTLAELDTLETGPLELTAYEDAMRKNAEALVVNLK